VTAPVRILTASEPWVEYQLDDGTFLRFRFTACSFRKTGKLTAQGDPEYTFSQSLLCETHVPQVVAEVRQLPRLVADTAPAEYVAPDSDCG
jgi:hypothetical protein